MAETIYLSLRTEAKQWVKTIYYIGILALGIFSFSAFWVRVISENAFGTPYDSLLQIFRGFLWVAGTVIVCWLIAVVIISFLNHTQIIELYRQQESDTIGLSEEALTLGAQIIAVHDLQSIVVESDQYAGAPRGRSKSSGAGKISIIYRSNKQERCFPIVVQSAHELRKLRELSAYWRSQKITAFIMD